MIPQLAALASIILVPSSTWGLDRIDAGDATTDGTTVDIYIIDSGVAPHPELGGRLEPGIDFVDNSGDGTTDCNGHGTHVAGIAAGSTTGVAPGATVVPVRILDCDGSGTSTALDAAVEWIVDHHDDRTPAVANLSLIGPASDALDNAALRMIDDGITVIVAAGNLGVDACSLSPARVPEVITVAASDQNDTRPTWSNFGPCVDLHAPGDRVTSLAPDGGTSLRSGTSIASPHVAGAAALILAEDPDATPAEVSAQLNAAARSVITGNDGTTTSLLLNITGATERSSTVRSTALTESARLVDTRVGVGGIAPGPVSTGDRLEVAVTSPEDAPRSTAVLTTTVTGTTVDHTGGYLTIEPCFDPTAEASNISTLNFTSGQTIANTAIVPVGPSGTVCVSVHGSAHVIIDRQEILSDKVLHPVSPFRRVDTRVGIGGVPAGALTDGDVLRVPVAGRDGIPASGVAAISANLTVTETSAPTTGGYVTIQPCGSTSNVSNINFAAGETVANAFITAVGESGDLCVTVHGSAQVMIDVNGWIESSGNITVVAPTRLVDTRLSVGSIGRADGQSSTITVDLGTSNLIPNGATSAIVNLTVTEVATSATGGYLSVHACGESATRSNMNFVTGDQRAVMLIAPLVEGRTCMTVVGQTALIIDLAGYVVG